VQQHSNFKQYLLYPQKFFSFTVPLKDKNLYNLYRVFTELRYILQD